MSQISKLGTQIAIAIRLDVPPELIAFVVTSVQAPRLQELFQGSSARLLAAHRNVLRCPNSLEAKYQRDRSKALLDLIRIRMASINIRKPAVGKMLALMDKKLPENVVLIRKAA